MRKLHEIFTAAKAHHSYWGGESDYMCHALDLAERAGGISEEEEQEGKEFARDLVESFHPDRCSLVGAMVLYFSAKGVDPGMHWDDVAGMVWEAVIDKLEADGK